MSNLGERIYSIRKKGLGLTQQQLVDKLNTFNNSNITRCMLSNWENGRQMPSINVLSALSAALGVSIDYLINGSDNLCQIDTSIPIPTLDGKTYIKSISDIDSITKFTPFDCTHNKKNIRFCIEVFDNNMAGAGVFIGDIVFVSNDRRIKNGDIAAVIIDEKISLKRYYECGGCCILSDECGGKTGETYKTDSATVKILGYACSLSRNIDII